MKCMSISLRIKYAFWFPSCRHRKRDTFYIFHTSSPCYKCFSNTISFKNVITCYIAKHIFDSVVTLVLILQSFIHQECFICLWWRLYLVNLIKFMMCSTYHNVFCLFNANFPSSFFTCLIDFAIPSCTLDSL